MFDNVRGVILFRADGDKIYQFINAVKSENVLSKTNSIPEWVCEVVL
jgi:hypothetical protein